MLLGFFALCGLHHILARARVISAEVKRVVPVVVNLSYSVAAGPHDGTHLIERGIRAIIADHESKLAANSKLAAIAQGRPPIVAVVVSADNGQLSRCHAETGPTGTDNETVKLTLPWRLQPGSRTSSYLELWVPKDATDLDLTLTPPDADPLTAITPDATTPKVLVDPATGHAVMRVTHDAIDATAALGAHGGCDGKARVLIAVAPTLHMPDESRPGSHRPPAPCGLWTVTLSATLPTKGQRIEAWIQRNDSLFAYRQRGRQSYFDDPAYQRFDARGDHLQDDPHRAPPTSVVRRQGTISGIATGPEVVVIGGYRRSAVEWIGGTPTLRNAAPLAPYSASAKASQPRGYADIRDPDAAAPCEESRVLTGISAAGARSGTRVALNGTSVAAPQATRRIAEALSQPGRPANFNAATFMTNVAAAPASHAPDARRQGSGLLEGVDTVPLRRA